VRPNGHLGEDWNGVGGGDTDLGDPIYSAADGIVTFAEDYRLGWGNVVIIRSAYLENGETKYVDSLYGHLLDFRVHVGQLVKRDELIARMGNNRGMYPAHLHFEMRKNINVGMYRSSFPRDWSVYWSPTEFVAAHRTCPGDSRVVSVPVNTYPSSPPPIIASPKVYTPTQTIAQAYANGAVVTGKSIGSSPLRRAFVAAAPSIAALNRNSALKPTPRPVATGPTATAPASTPAPIAHSSTPTPITRASTPAPVARSSTPAPITRASTPAPVARSSTPAPVARSSTPAPVARSSTSAHVARSSTPAPIAHSSTSASIGRSTTPAPGIRSSTHSSAAATATHSSTPAPVARASTPPPNARSSTPAPIARTSTPTPAPTPAEQRSTNSRHPLFRVNRFEDMKILGYGGDQ
jgi:hypothetical protein